MTFVKLHAYILRTAQSMEVVGPEPQHILIECTIICSNKFNEYTLIEQSNVLNTLIEQSGNRAFWNL